MTPAPSSRILVVANRTAATPLLVQEVERRARAGPCEFALLIPDVTDRSRADWTLDVALPVLERVARGRVRPLVGGRDPFEAVEGALRDGRYDEVIVSTLPRRRSRWLRRDLVHRIEQLGIPVTAVSAGDRPSDEQAVLRVRVVDE